MAGYLSGGFGDSFDEAVTVFLAPFQIPPMGRATGVSGLSAASPVGMATRSGPGPVAMRAPPQSLGHVIVQTAQVGLCRGVAPSSSLVLSRLRQETSNELTGERCWR